MSDINNSIQVSSEIEKMEAEPNRRQSVSMYTHTLARLMRLGTMSESYDTLINRLLDMRIGKCDSVIERLAADLQECRQDQKRGRKRRYSKR